jgi:signal transduction histidine kinase
LKEIFQEKINREQLSIRLILKIPSKELNLFSDELRIKQILANLLSNALKFTEDGEVVFGFRRVKNHKIRFFVKDTGIGIPKDKQKMIFERFRQADDSSTRKYGGTGLGLAISKNLVELLKGKIDVQSEVNMGSEFYFTLPENIRE